MNSQVAYTTRILIIEDDATIREHLALQLSEEGYRVDVAGNGLEALTKMRATTPPPDLIILDLRMPVMDGWQFRVEQRRNPNFKNIPLIAISADATAQAAAIDADFFIRKPFGIEEILEAVQKISIAVHKERARVLDVAHADRLASLGLLAAGVAHEINNPLAYMVANIEFINGELSAISAETGSERIPAIRRAMDEIRDGAERVKHIVRDLKAFGRADTEQRKELELESVLELSIKMAFIEIRHRARLVKAYGRTPAIDGDETRLSQVFMNILVNAAHALPEGRADQNEIRISTRTTEDGFALVEISDTGLGIAESLGRRVFDPFVTSKPVGAGTGLGLSICHGIVEAHGGTITFESNPGNGTVFRVALPPSITKSRESTPDSAPVLTEPTRRGRVLVVDDDALIAFALRRILDTQHDVTLASNGREALELFQRGERFDVILCDLMMPQMTGMDLYAELSELAPDQVERMVLITGGAFTPRAQAFLDRIPNRCIEKPFDVLSLSALVRTLVNAQPVHCSRARQSRS